MFSPYYLPFCIFFHPFAEWFIKSKPTWKDSVSIVSGTAILLASGGVKDEGGASATTKKNLEVNAAIGKRFETGDFSKIGDYLAEDFVDYAGMTGPVKGIEANKSLTEMMANMDSSKSMMSHSGWRWWNRLFYGGNVGNLQKDMMGMKAGQKVEGKSIEVTKFKDGKAIAHWTYMTPGWNDEDDGGCPHATGWWQMHPDMDTTKKGM